MCPLRDRRTEKCPDLVLVRFYRSKNLFCRYELEAIQNRITRVYRPGEVDSPETIHSLQDDRRLSLRDIPRSRQFGDQRFQLGRWDLPVNRTSGW